MRVMTAVAVFMLMVSPARATFLGSVQANEGVVIVNDWGFEIFRPFGPTLLKLVFRDAFRFTVAIVNSRLSTSFHTAVYVSEGNTFRVTYPELSRWSGLVWKEVVLTFATGVSAAFVALLKKTCIKADNSPPA